MQAVLVTHFGHDGMMASWPLDCPEAGISLWHRVSDAVEMPVGAVVKLQPEALSGPKLSRRGRAFCQRSRACLERRELHFDFLRHRDPKAIRGSQDDAVAMGAVSLRMCPVHRYQ